MRAWHFTTDKLRDGRPVPAIGKTLRHEGKIKMCRSGLHASKRILDALTYAPGHFLHRVELRVNLDYDSDKTVGRERTILWTIDAEDLLRDFARRCALDVVHLWDAPDIVVQYFKTGDESIRAAAWDAAWAAARAAAWDVAEDAARAAARAAAWAAARAAAGATAWDAARDAARAAAWDAAGDAARDAAWDAAWAAAWDAAWDAQNKRLTSMIMAEYRKQNNA